MRILIIDDEAPARESFSELLADHPDVTIVGEAAEVSEAIALCQLHQPDALFLDVEMGRGSGFDLIKSLGQDTPALIFVTAHEQFALHAFDFLAIDYLLKPVHPKRLATSLKKLRIFLDRPLNSEKIQLTLDDGLAMIDISTITHIQADANYTHVFINNGKKLHVRKSLQSWEEQLPPNEFTRIHRSLLVNLLAIERVWNTSRDEGHLALRGQITPLPLARRALQRLRSILQKEQN